MLGCGGIESGRAVGPYGFGIMLPLFLWLAGKVTILPLSVDFNPAQRMMRRPEPDVVAYLIQN